MPSFPVVTTLRTEAERVVVYEAGGVNTLSMSLVLLMRSTGMTLIEATAIVRACKWAKTPGNIPSEYLGDLYRRSLVEMTEVDEMHEDS